MPGGPSQFVSGVLGFTIALMACGSRSPDGEPGHHAGPRFESIPVIDTVITESACSKCSVDARHVISLGDENEGQLDNVNAAARDTRGRYWVATQQRMHELLLFDAKGKFLRTVGRKGSGPGEFQGITALARRPNDTLHVFDHILRRWTVISPADKAIHTWNLPASVAWDAVAVQNGMVVLNVNPEPRPPSAPLVLVDSTGIRKSFGGDAGIVPGEDRPYLAWRKLSPSREGGVWSIPINEFRLEAWSFAGKKLKEIVRKPPPFERWLSPVAPGSGRPSQSSVSALQQDDDGLLWVLLRVPDPRWRGTVEEVQTPEGKTTVPTDPNDVYDTLVEVIDPASGTLLVSQRLQVDLRGFVDS